MDFSLPEAHKEQYDSIVAFAQSTLADDVAHRDQHAEFSYQLWERCAEFGVLGWSVPEHVGGSGYSVSRVICLMEALGYGCRDNGLLFALGTQLWGVQSALLRFGSPEQTNNYLPRMLTGRAIGAYAINESGSGSDAFALDTTATKDGNNYVLDGEKVLITLSPVADFAIVFAITNRDAGRWGLSAFIIDTDTPGLIAHANEHMMGLRTVPFGRVTLEQCRVPVSALLGKEGAGASIFTYSQSWERSLILAPQIGTMKRQIEDSVTFAKARVRADHPIGQYQAVSHRIADMVMRCETSRLLLQKTAWLLEQGKQNVLEAAITKTHLSEAFVSSSRDAIALYGGTGYATRHGVERNLRDAIGGTIYGGTSDVQRTIIAGLLGL